MLDRLLEERLVVCGNLAAGLQSLYVWKGERGTAAEVGLLLKTDAALLDALVARLEVLHPYEQPAIFGWPCTVSGTATRTWTAQLHDPEPDRARTADATTRQGEANPSGHPGNPRPDYP